VAEEDLGWRDSTGSGCRCWARGKEPHLRTSQYRETPAACQLWISRKVGLAVVLVRSAQGIWVVVRLGSGAI
jgi:hypothetical protein